MTTTLRRKKTKPKKKTKANKKKRAKVNKRTKVRKRTKIRKKTKVRKKVKRRKTRSRKKIRAQKGGINWKFGIIAALFGADVAKGYLLPDYRKYGSNENAIRAAQTTTRQLMSEMRKIEETTSGNACYAFDQKNLDNERQRYRDFKLALNRRKGSFSSEEQSKNDIFSDATNTLMNEVKDGHVCSDDLNTYFQSLNKYAGKEGYLTKLASTVFGRTKMENERIFIDPPKQYDTRAEWRESIKENDKYHLTTGEEAEAAAEADALMNKKMDQMLLDDDLKEATGAQDMGE